MSTFKVSTCIVVLALALVWVFACMDLSRNGVTEISGGIGHDDYYLICIYSSMDEEELIEVLNEHLSPVLEETQEWE